MKNRIPVWMVALLAGCGGGGGGSGATSDDGGAGNGGAGGGAAGDGGGGGAFVPDPVGPPTGDDELPRCDEPLFIDAIDESAWVNVDVSPGGGTAAIREAIDSAHAEHPDEPVRVRLGAGVYEDTLGSEVFVQRVQRTAAAPLLLMAVDPTPNATVLGHGLNFLGVSYIGIQGITIGPAEVGAWNPDTMTHADPQPGPAAAGVHVAGAAANARASAVRDDGTLDPEVYGRYEPSHHIVVRDLTIQNLFGGDDPSGEAPIGLDHDGMKFNQVQNLWVIGNTVTQTSRHGIDNVGVHRAAFCANTISRNGQGLGIEAKGGSYLVVYEGNTFYRTRRVDLGGENTDGTYYFSADGRYDYEARRVVARNNLIVDARETALEFSSCVDCSAIGNTIYYSSGYVPPLTESGDANGGDALRVHDSLLLPADEGAGSDCVTWDAEAQDYVTVDPCWGLGSHAPAPVGRALKNANLTVANNVFVAAGGQWSFEFGSFADAPSTIPCTLNQIGEIDRSIYHFESNHWFNGGTRMPTDGCFDVPEGDGVATVGDDPGFPGEVDGASIRGLLGTAATALTPAMSSPIARVGRAGVADAPRYDFRGEARPETPTPGALEAR